MHSRNVSSSQSPLRTSLAAEGLPPLGHATFNGAASPRSAPRFAPQAQQPAALGVSTPTRQPSQGVASPQLSATSADAGRPPQWSLQDFDIGPKLGEGRFGKIYLAREKTTHCAVVIKCINKDAIVRLDMTHQLKREVALQRYVSAGAGGKHIVRLYAYFWDLYTVYLVLEYCEGGDLLATLKNSSGGRLPERLAACYIRDVLRALAHMHELGVLHRDVKPDNILIRRNRCKLADLTWAVQCERDERRATLCGTLDYLSPELVSSAGHGAAADVWSVGIVAYEMLCGRPPFEHPQARMTCTAIQKGVLPPFPSDVSREAEAFVRALLHVIPEDRPSAQQALRHPWMTSLPQNDDALRSASRDAFPSQRRSGSRDTIPVVRSVVQASDLLATAFDDVSAATVGTSNLRPSRLVPEDVSRALDLNPGNTDPPSSSSVGALATTASPQSSTAEEPSVTGGGATRGSPPVLVAGRLASLREPVSAEPSAIVATTASMMNSMMRPPVEDWSSSRSSSSGDSNGPAPPARQTLRTHTPRNHVDDLTDAPSGHSTDGAERAARGDDEVDDLDGVSAIGWTPERR